MLARLFLCTIHDCDWVCVASTLHRAPNLTSKTSNSTTDGPEFALRWEVWAKLLDCFGLYAEDMFDWLRDCAVKVQEHLQRPRNNIEVVNMRDDAISIDVQPLQMVADVAELMESTYSLLAITSYLHRCQPAGIDCGIKHHDRKLKFAGALIASLKRFLGLQKPSNSAQNSAIGLFEPAHSVVRVGLCFMFQLQSDVGTVHAYKATVRKVSKQLSLRADALAAGNIMDEDGRSDVNVALPHYIRYDSVWPKGSLVSPNDEWVHLDLSRRVITDQYGHCVPFIPIHGACHDPHNCTQLITRSVHTLARIANFVTGSNVTDGTQDDELGVQLVDKVSGAGPTSATERFRAWISKPAGLSSRLGFQTQLGRHIASRIEQVVGAVSTEQGKEYVAEDYHREPLCDTSATSWQLRCQEAQTQARTNAAGRNCPAIVRTNPAALNFEGFVAHSRFLTVGTADSMDVPAGAIADMARVFELTVDEVRSRIKALRMMNRV